jgi:hypothetical protein
MKNPRAGKISDKERLDWLLRHDEYGRNRRFIDQCIRDECSEAKARGRK